VTLGAAQAAPEGFVLPFGAGEAANLEIPHVHHSDGDDEGVSPRLSLVFEQAQVDYCLAQ